MHKNTKINLLITGSFLALCLFFFRRIIFTSENILLGAIKPHDLISHIIPLKYFAYNSLKTLNLPLWNPYLFCGSPMLAVPQTSVFYPVHFIFLALPLFKAINISIALHFMLAGIFTYYYARLVGLSRFSAFLSGFVFMFSSVFILHATVGHLDNITSMVWLPLVLLFLERFLREPKVSNAIFAAIVCAIQILSGHLQYVFYTFLAVIIYVLVFLFSEKDSRRRKSILTGTICLFAGALFISAIQLLPTTELLIHSTRSIPKYEFISFFALPIHNLITLAIPEFFGNMLDFPYWGGFYFWEMCIYIGVLPLLLAIAAITQLKENKHILFFGILTALSLFLAVGYHIPGVKSVLQHIPIFNLFRGHSKFIFLSAFSLSMLCGFGIKTMTDLRKDNRLNKKAVVLLILPLLFIGCIYGALMFLDYNVVISMWRALLSGCANLNRDLTIGLNYNDTGFIKASLGWAYKAAGRFLLFFIISLFVMSLFLARSIRLKLIKLIIFAFIFVDLWGFNVKFIRKFYPKKYDWNRNVVDFLQSDDEPFRSAYTVLRLPNSGLDLIGLNMGMKYDVQSIGGYSVLLLKRYSKFMQASQSYYAQNPSDIVFVTNPSKLLDLINLKYIFVAPDIEIRNKNSELCFSDSGIKLYRNLNVLARAFIVPQVKIIQDENRIIDELKSEDFDPEKYVIITEEPKKSVPDNPDLKNYVASAQIKEYLPNKVTIQTQANQSGFLVLSDSFYPGWKVYVDKRLDKIYRANLFMRAVYLDKGNHSIKFIYSPLSFKLGALLSLLTILIMSIYLVRGKRKSSR